MSDILKISRLSKNFGGVKAVNKCSFGISKGKITALIGPNGSGKTTVFNLISGILKPDEGEIMFRGHNITNHMMERISNKGISRLFQKSRLFDNLTIWENLEIACDKDNVKFWKSLFVKPEESSKKIEDILKLVDMYDFKDKRTDELSFGQRRLAEIARAILKPHKLLMLDEPVAGVTPKLRTEIRSLLERLREQGETILLIEHDMNFTLKLADEVIVMDEGRVIAKGSPVDIKNNKQVLEAYLGNA